MTEFLIPGSWSTGSFLCPPPVGDTSEVSLLPAGFGLGLLVSQGSKRWERLLEKSFPRSQLGTVPWAPRAVLLPSAGSFSLVPGC